MSYAMLAILALSSKEFDRGKAFANAAQVCLADFAKPSPYTRCEIEVAVGVVAYAGPTSFRDIAANFDGTARQGTSHSELLHAHFKLPSAIVIRHAEFACYAISHCSLSAVLGSTLSTLSESVLISWSS
jgi:hypothetical protein